MGFFDFLKGPDINQGVKEYSATDGAVLLDVRTPDEYRQGPHQLAQKSSRTGFSEFRTSFRKLFLLILITDIVLSSLFLSDCMVPQIMIRFCDVVTLFP